MIAVRNGVYVQYMTEYSYILWDWGLTKTKMSSAAHMVVLSAP